MSVGFVRKCCRSRSFRQVWYKSTVDCVRNASKMAKYPLSGRNDEENEKVIRNLHADPDRHQKLITSTRGFS